MSFIMLILLFLFFADSKIASQNQFFSDYCSMEKTKALKGIFVMMVFTSHFRSYVDLGTSDEFAVCIVNFLGQLMVTPFLFYSGFGVAESIHKKGMKYVNRLPIDRALKTLIHFDMAVCLFVVIRLILGTPTSIKTLLYSFVCWESLGNSTWYIFGIVSLYLITAISFKLLRNEKFASFLTTALVLVLIRILSPFRDQHWYNTLLCYPLGIWYSLYKEKIEKYVMRNDVTYCITLIILYCAFVFLNMRPMSHWEYNIYAMIFVLLVVVMSMKFSFNNAFLQFLGDHIFEIYILQRLPMIMFAHYGILANNNIALYVLCFFCTCILAMWFHKCTNYLDILWKKIFR